MITGAMPREISPRHAATEKEKPGKDIQQRLYFRDKQNDSFALKYNLWKTVQDIAA